MWNYRSRYYGYRFPPEIISYAVWVYYSFCLSLRDVEDLLAERGIIVSYETIRLWCQKFGPDYARKLKRASGPPRRYLALGRINGQQQYLWCVRLCLPEGLKNVTNNLPYGSHSCQCEKV